MKKVESVLVSLTIALAVAVQASAAEKQQYPDLKAPWANSLGMKFVPVQGTEVLFCIWETRVQDYEPFVKATGQEWPKGLVMEPKHPAANVSWDDAHKFCAWLTEKERATGLLGPNQEYRLPTDWEWSVAVGLDESRTGTPKDKDEKIKGVYPWGHDWPPSHNAGNFLGEESKNGIFASTRNLIAGYNDGFVYSSPVGSFKPNQFGLYDLSGNVWEWCEDFYDGQSGSRVLRGGSFASGEPGLLLSSRRMHHSPNRRDGYGFRIVMSQCAPPQIVRKRSTDPSMPTRPIPTRPVSPKPSPTPPVPMLPIPVMRREVASLDRLAMAPTDTVFRFDALLARSDLWTLSPRDFSTAVKGNGFYWLDNQMNAARATADGFNLGFLNQCIWEALVKFESNHLSRVEFSFYNRGDAGHSSIEHHSFTNLVHEIGSELSSWSGAPCQLSTELPGPARTKIYHAVWIKPPTRLELEWSGTPLRTTNEATATISTSFRADFIRLKVFPIATLVAATKERPNLGRTPIDIKAHVLTTTNGYVFISNIPMVDQGPKSYCAPAVASRLMRYYGLDLDMHQAAQVADTDAEQGTTSDNLINSLKSIAKNANLRFLVIRKSGMALDDKTARNKEFEFNRFKADIARQIDVGVPLVWGVHLGIVQEENGSRQKGIGRHLRLIIGYNKKTDHILYSDTWGPGHECKSMNLNDALRITNGLYTIKPDNL